MSFLKSKKAAKAEEVPETVVLPKEPTTRPDHVPVLKALKPHGIGPGECAHSFRQDGHSNLLVCSYCGGHQHHPKPALHPHGQKA